jgi:hypothetical protein
LPLRLTTDHIKRDGRGAYVELAGNDGLVERVSLPAKLQDPAIYRDANEDQPWSQMDIEDLKASHAYGDDIEQIASFLCRRIGEVREKAAELGLQFKRQVSASSQSRGDGR